MSLANCLDQLPLEILYDFYVFNFHLFFIWTEMVTGMLNHIISNTAFINFFFWSGHSMPNASGQDTA